MPDICPRCQVNEGRHDGRRLRWCKPCDAEYRRQWVGKRKQEGLTIHDAARLKERQREWAIKNRDAINAKARAKWIDPANTPKNKARNAVNGAVRRGSLKKLPCACGAFDVEAHHEDYSRPLDVVWVCRPCHDAIHHQ